MTSYFDFMAQKQTGLRPNRVRESDVVQLDGIEGADVIEVDGIIVLEEEATPEAMRRYEACADPWRFVD